MLRGCYCWAISSDPLVSKQRFCSRNYKASRGSMHTTPVYPHFNLCSSGVFLCVRHVEIRICFKKHLVLQAAESKRFFFHLIVSPSFFTQCLCSCQYKRHWQNIHITNEHEKCQGNGVCSCVGHKCV